MDNLIYFCKSFSTKIEKCNFYINLINDQIKYSISNIIYNKFQILFFYCFFLLIILILLSYNNLKKKTLIIFCFFNFFLIFFLIFFFQNKLPFTDSWYELNDLLLDSKNHYVLTKLDYFLFSFRFFHIIILNKFFLNYHFITFLNFFIFLLSFIFLLLIIKEYKATKYFSIFLLIFFNGKWINVFYEPVNIVWTVNFLLLLVYCYFFKIQHWTKYLILFLVLFLSIINFKGSLVIIIFSIFYGVFILRNNNFRFFFIMAPLFIFLVIYFLTDFVTGLFIEYDKIIPSNNISKINFFEIFKSFLSIQSSVFFPNIKISLYLSAILSLFQNLLILKYLINNKNFIINTKLFILGNPLLIIGYIGCFLVALGRDDILQIRYFSFSLLFQLGFIIFIIKNYAFVNKRIIYTSLKYFLTITFIVNLLFFNQGVHFALSKYTVYAKSLECLRNASDIEICKKYIYEMTFYNDNAFKTEVYSMLFDFLQKNKLSIFRDL